MSGELEDEKAYRIDELPSIPLEELRTMYKKVVNELIMIKVEFEEF